MADRMTPQFSDGQNEINARDILNRMSRHRIEAARIRTTDTVPGIKSGQGVVLTGTLLPSVAPHPGWSPEAIEKLVFDRCADVLLEEFNDLPPKLLKFLCSEAIKGLFVEQEVAVKKLEWPRDDAEQSTKFFKSFVNELSLMASLSHENIIKFLGFVEDMENGKAWIITPWEVNGNVREFLQSGEFDIPERVSLIQDTASGLEYLHTHDPPICHGDLKSLNILVNSFYRAVITDFGSARTSRGVASGNQSEMPSQIPPNDNLASILTSPQVKFSASTLDLTLTGPRFSLRWTAPEVLRDMIQDLPSDMWAVGWICWEIITGRVPFERLDNEAVIITHALFGKLPAIRRDNQLSHALMLCSLMSDCWLSNPSERIDVSTFNQKVRKLVSPLSKGNVSDSEMSVWKPSVIPSVNTSEGPKTRSAALLLQLGQWAERQDDWVKAESYYLSAIEVATETGNEVAKGYALEHLGNVYKIKSDSQKAEGLYKQAQEIYSRTGNSLLAVNSLNGLGMVYQSQSKHPEAERCFMEAFETLSRVGDDVGTANALDCLGTSYGAQSKYREAEKAFKSAYEIRSRIGDELGTALTLVKLGHTHRIQSRYQEAEQAFSAGHEIYSRIGNDLGVAHALDGLGKTYRVQYKFKEAETALTSAYKMHSRIGIELGSANALAALEYAYCAQSRVREAQQSLAAAYEIHSRIGNPLGTAEALVGLGVIYYRLQSRYQEAEEAFKTSQEISSRISNDSGIAKASNELGEVYRLQSRIQEAEGAFNTAYEIYNRIGDPSGTATALNGLGEVYSVQERYQEAEKAFNKAYTIHASLGDHHRADDSLHGLQMLYSNKNGPVRSSLKSI